MKLKLIVGTFSAVVLIASNLAGADWNDRWRYESGTTDKFREPEMTLDLFGTWADHDKFGDDTAHVGGGLGINYFPSRFLGLGVDSYLEEWRWPYRVNGSAIGRFPLGQSGLAPYGLIGGGREFKYVTQWYWHAGGGLELKLNPYTGLFADGRRVFADKTPDYTLVRAGLRLGF